MAVVTAMADAAADLWGKLAGPTSIALQDDDDKSTIRKRVWEFMERNDVALYPRPVYHRVPNFKGSALAGDAVADLEQFKAAKTVFVAGEKSLEEVRLKVLESGKSLLVPCPGMSRGLLSRLSAAPGAGPEELRKLASQKGVENEGKPVPMASRLKVDLFVVGSVCVDDCGRRLGDGDGATDLLWALSGAAHNAIHQDTVFECLPRPLFRHHDLPVDVVVTPTRVIRVAGSAADDPKKATKDAKVRWNLIPQSKLDKIPILKEIHHKEKSLGKDVRLLGEDNVTVAQQENGLEQNSGGEDNKDPGKKRKKAKRSQAGKKGQEHTAKSEDAAPAKEHKNVEGQTVTPAPQNKANSDQASSTHRKSRKKPATSAVAAKEASSSSVKKSADDANAAAADDTNGNSGPALPADNKKKHNKSKKAKKKQKLKELKRNEAGTSEKKSEDDEGDNDAADDALEASNKQEAPKPNFADFAPRKRTARLTVFIGKIPRSARVKQLKDALEERGLSLSNNSGAYLAWKGFKGYAFLNVDAEKHSLDDLEAKLKDLKIGDIPLRVQTDQRSPDLARENGEEEPSNGTSAANESNAAAAAAPSGAE